MISENITQVSDQEMIKKALSITDVTKKRARKKVKMNGDDHKEKRRLNEDQVKLLEMHFEREQKLELGRKINLAEELGMDANQVAVWFQNRRVRWKHKQLEIEHEKLKAKHMVILAEKHQLENEVLKLKGRINEAEEKIKKVSGSSNEGVNGLFDGHCSTSYSNSVGEEYNLMGDFVDEISKEYINMCANELMSEHCMPWW
ncbi:homeobox-leucine zipper protein ATHB-40-like [Dioscorea cayenensis subsp. rotundata]|uniref:Homeobox-leucine zipper protein n=1 Tax=Dioscorea cayennensis subsp. rotundata TaxID=55577 RepID=A0AB40BVH8_DIOCR|nr:homeobox-leucine zipper protein ATHB-40-like [Dioscorea cayenensis subsp. rotundata]